MPDLSLNFTDPTVLGDAGAAFHSCVRYHRWRKEKVVSFVPRESCFFREGGKEKMRKEARSVTLTLTAYERVPADGTFTLLTFQHKPPLPLMTTTSARLAAALLLPFSLISSHTLGPAGGAFDLTLTARANLTNLVVRIPLASEIDGAGQVQATVSGGALLRDEEGRSIGGGAGRFEVVEEEVSTSTNSIAGNGIGGTKEATRKRIRLVLVWRIESLSPTDRPAVLSGQYNTTCVLSLSYLRFVCQQLLSPRRGKAYSRCLRQRTGRRLRANRHRSLSRSRARPGAFLACASTRSRS